MSELKSLKQSSENKSVYEDLISGKLPGYEVLEIFANPLTLKDAELKLNIEIPEFTSLCPITGQPDFAKIKIEYVPDKFCIESKSLKLYTLSFREKGMFHEACVSLIINDLVNILDPTYIKVIGEFTPRGGIPFWPTAEYTKLR